jgi:hypothetical protein
VHPGDGVGVLDAHLSLQAVGVAEEDAEDRAEVGVEVVAGAAGDQPVPDLVERAEGAACSPRWSMWPRPNIGACRSSSVFPTI